MQNYKYRIIGGGMTADAAVSGIREVDSQGSIGLISSDSDPTYARPPLTKALWKGKPLDSVWRHTKERKVDLDLERTANAIDMEPKTVADDKKEVYQTLTVEDIQMAADLFRPTYDRTEGEDGCVSLEVSPHLAAGWSNRLPATPASVWTPWRVRGHRLLAIVPNKVPLEKRCF